ncbi:MAG TPA: D-alanine--D-alanine ligase family protein [Solirubrobacteraceae bacterium]|nr:D-alanine--D-alanine ligase family protein [Solirubrobacteraceae bacterium]
MRIAVLAGGRSSEHDVSLSSAASVREGLTAAGHDVTWVELARDGSWSCKGEEVALQAGGGLLGADAVFPALHGPFGEDGTVQGLLELLDVAYVGSGVLASALCMDKVLFKDVMGHAGLPQVPYWSLDAAAGVALADASAVSYPCWVKPARLGSSVGIARVDAPGELEAAIEAAAAHDPRVIVEAGAAGIEVECSVLGPTDAPQASQPGEILLAGGEDGWYDYEAKYSAGGMELVVPARISDAARERVRELAVTAFRLAGCSGLARADFFVDGEDVLLNELNTMPGFTQTSVYGKLWDHSGVPYPELCDRLVRIAIERYERGRAYRY